MTWSNANAGTVRRHDEKDSVIQEYDKQDGYQSPNSTRGGRTRPGMAAFPLPGCLRYLSLVCLLCLLSFALPRYPVPDSQFASTVLAPGPVLFSSLGRCAFGIISSYFFIDLVSQNLNLTHLLRSYDSVLPRYFDSNGSGFGSVDIFESGSILAAPPWPDYIFSPWNCSTFLRCYATLFDVRAIFETPRAYLETATARLTAVLISFHSLGISILCHGLLFLSHWWRCLTEFIRFLIFGSFAGNAFQPGYFCYDHAVISAGVLTRTLKSILSSNPLLSSHNGFICNILGHGMLGISLLLHSDFFRCSCTPHMISLSTVSSYCCNVSVFNAQVVGPYEVVSFCREALFWNFYSPSSYVCSTTFGMSHFSGIVFNLLSHLSLSVQNVYAFTFHVYSEMILAPSFALDSGINAVSRTGLFMWLMWYFSVYRGDKAAARYTVSNLFVDAVVYSVIDVRFVSSACILSHNGFLLSCFVFRSFVLSCSGRNYDSIVTVLRDIIFGRFLVFWCLNAIRYTHALRWSSIWLHGFFRKFTISNF